MNGEHKEFWTIVCAERLISDNDFGILVARFDVFRTCRHRPPETAICVALPALALHNFLLTKNGQGPVV